jgi:hypothetical protein
MFDFALHMPANAMWFATLAGVMFHPGVEEPYVATGRELEHDRRSTEVGVLLGVEHGDMERETRL